MNPNSRKNQCELSQVEKIIHELLANAHIPLEHKKTLLSLLFDLKEKLLQTPMEIY